MTRTPSIRSALVRLALATSLIATLFTSGTVLAADPVRPEVGKPLQAAQDLMKSGRHKDAMARLVEADNVAGKTPYETYMVQRVRGSVATAAGDTDAAIRAWEAVIASGRLTAQESPKIIQALAGLYYKNKEYPKAAQWATRYFKEGGNDPAMRTVLAQAHYLNNDCAAVSRALQLDAGGDNGRRVSEDQLQMLSACQLKMKDNAGYLNTLERLVTSYPKKEYWADLIRRARTKSGFSSRLDLDLLRLKYAVNGDKLETADDYMEFAQLSVQAGAPAEAKRVFDQGFTQGVLGNGNEGERHKRLRDLITKALAEEQKNQAQALKDAEAAKDGNALVTIGFSLAMAGNVDKGVALMDQGIRKGELKRPDDAKLHLAYALLQGKKHARAIQVFRTVHGKDGPADVARLWVLHAGRS